jgi:hypothetical protein
MSRTIGLAAGMLGLLGTSLGAWGQVPPAIRVGEPFPDLVLPRLEDGRPASLADFRGTKLVLHVFASW